MGKKSKKSETQAKGQVMETNNQTAQENNIEVTQVDVESVPATIVESGEAQVFASEHGEQKVSTETESQVVDGPVTGEGDKKLEAGRVPKPRINRRPYIDWVTQHLELGDMERKEMVKEVLKEFPTIKKGGIETFLTDALNPKYSYYKDRTVLKRENGKLVFADKVEAIKEDPPAAPVPVEAVTGVEMPEVQPEQPGE
jgi:hypothetical protein